MMHVLRRLYDWVLSWAHSRYGTWALGVLSFAESSFFPVPPDTLLIALSVSRPKRSFFYALVCSVASVAGGVGGYLIGLFLFEAVGREILNFYGVMNEYERLVVDFRHYGFLSVFIAALTPIPYKLFTIASGVANLNMTTFLLASVLGRSGRFFAEAILIFFFGKAVKVFIDRYFNLLTLLLGGGLIAGFLVLRFLIHLRIGT